MKQELNVKAIEVRKTDQSEVTVTLDTNLTPALIDEGKARQLIRQIQVARKTSGTLVNERIDVELPSWPASFEAEIKTKVKADNLRVGAQLKIIRR
jgi:hypothetical protein